MKEDDTLIIKVPATSGKGGSSPPPGGGGERPRGIAACLVILSGDQLGRRLDLTSSTKLGVGDTVEEERNSDAPPIATLTFDEDGTLELRSLSIPAQTFVNDRPVVRARLKHGDRLRIGTQELKVLIAADLEAAYHEELYRLVTHDNLTEAFNQRYLMDNLSQLTSRSRRWGGPLSLAVVRLGNLAEFRKKHGEAQAILALRRLAAVLIELSRSDDIVARVSEEEFIVVLFHTDREGAALFTDRVGQIPTGGQLEIVVGVATLDVTTLTAERLIEEARTQVNPWSTSNRDE